MTLVKDQLFEEQRVPLSTGLGVDRFDHEGRTIQAEFDDFTLFNLYVPNGGRDLERVPFKLDFYAALLDKCDALHAAGKNVIICGDINTSHQEIDVDNPRPKMKITGFLPEERAWITKFLDHGFVDVFRERNPEMVQYTYWSYMQNQRGKNKGWRSGLLPGLRGVRAASARCDHAPGRTGIRPLSGDVGFALSIFHPLE